MRYNMIEIEVIWLKKMMKKKKSFLIKVVG